MHRKDVKVISKEAYRNLLFYAITGFINENGFDPEKVAEFGLRIIATTGLIACEQSCQYNSYDTKNSFSHLPSLSFINNLNIDRKDSVSELTNNINNLTVSMPIDETQNRALRCSQG